MENNSTRFTANGGNYLKQNRKNIKFGISVSVNRNFLRCERRRKMD